MEYSEKSLIASNVSVKENPCKRVWDEYDAGQIPLDELLDSVYMIAIQNELQNYRCRKKINVPEGLYLERDAFREKIIGAKESDRSALEAAFYKRTYPENKGYYDSFEALEYKNKSDLFFLCEMFDFYDGRNRAYASKANDLILEYLEEGYKKPEKHCET